MERRLICVKFDANNPLTNFHQLMKERPVNTLFIYNENVEQFLNKCDTTPGGGNGVMRMYRADRPDFHGHGTTSGALGIPTMFMRYSVVDDNERFTTLLGHVHQAFSQIHAFLLAHPAIKNVVWSADRNLCIGLSIAIQAKRISVEQADALQNVVKMNMITLMEHHNMKKLVYDRSDGSITDEDMCTFLGIV